MNNVVMSDSLAVINPPTWSELAWNTDVLNLAVNGTTTTIWVTTPIAWVPHAAPGQAWWILLGANDAFQDLTWQDYPANTQSIISTLILNGVSEIHLMQAPSNQNPLVDPVRLVETNNRLEWMNAQDLVLCDGNPLVFCGPDLWVETTHPDDFDALQVHFNALGHGKVALLVPEPSINLMLIVGVLVIAMLRKVFK